MLVFEYILILLAAILLSNFINRFIPSVSVPVVQIILGACISFLPLGVTLELEPALFFVLFIAPLIFNASLLLDKRTFWTLKGPILNMAFVLVILTVVGLGYFVHALIPIIPLAAAFVLVAALAPTDDVAIISVAQRVNIPPKLMSILSGESIINDASGIVCFQFAVAAVITGSFSVIQATERLFIIGLGGILVGLLFTLVKYLFIRWIRRLGMENVTLHILIEILTPFLVYMTAEELGVSGILAVFAAGIAHSLGRRKINPETANLNAASKSIWSVLSFTLEGIVYLILGTQLPAILNTVQSGSYSISVQEIILYVLILTLAFAGSRFIWSYLTIRSKRYSDPENKVSKVRACLICSLSGARGAVTMASALSIPVWLSDGIAFPQRDLIILLSTGVIICSLFITNFILPLVVAKDTETGKRSKENEACIEILNNVMASISSQVDEEDKAAMGIVLRQYKSRIQTLRNRLDAKLFDCNVERKLKIQAWEWEKENTMYLLKHGEVDVKIAGHYVDTLDTLIAVESKGKYNPLRIILKMYKRLAHNRKFHREKHRNFVQFRRFFELRVKNDLYVVDKLKEKLATDNSYEMRKLISDYEASSVMMQSMSAMPRRRTDLHAIEKKMQKIVSLGFQIERDNIQSMFENGRISWETARELRNNITLLETDME